MRGVSTDVPQAFGMMDKTPSNRQCGLSVNLTFSTPEGGRGIAYRLRYKEKIDCARFMLTFCTGMASPKKGERGAVPGSNDKRSTTHTTDSRGGEESCNHV